jgi:3-hydroxyisobutyrate dehydrogenase-like beta-hydroxyacid dehydrogenase
VRLRCRGCASSASCLRRRQSGQIQPCVSQPQHLLKDVKLFESEAAAAGIDTRLLQALQGVVADAVARGFENNDYSAVFDPVKHARKGS